MPVTDSPGPRQEWIRQAVVTYQQPLVLYAMKFTGRLELAREVVQDTFLKLCEQSQDELDGRLAPWLYTVCRNRALDVLRKEKPMKSLADPDHHLHDRSAANPLATLARSEMDEAVVKAIGELPARQQELLRLKFQHGLSYRDIAEVTQLSPSNVGYLLHMAIKSLRRTLASEPDADALQA